MSKRNARAGVGLRYMIVASTAMIFACSLLFVCVSTNVTMRKSLLEQSVDYWLGRSYTDQITMMNYLLLQGDEVQSDLLLESSAPFFANHLARNRENCDLQIYNSRGKLLGSSLLPEEDPGTGPDVEGALGGVKSYMVVRSSGREILLMSSPLLQNGKTIGCLRYVLPMDKDQSLVNSMFARILGASVGTLVLAVVLLYLLSAQMVRPLRQLYLATSRMADGEFIRISSLSSYREVNELVGNFNEMSDRLGNYVTSLQNERTRQETFFNNVTHELKTPLTSIMGYSQMIDRLGPQDERVGECNGFIRRESERLHRQIERILNLSGNFHHDPLVLVPVELHALAEECITVLRPRMEMAGIRPHNELPADLAVSADLKRTREVLLNLMDNCIKYSHADTLRFYLRGRWELVAEDNGRGVPEESLSMLAEPFFRIRGGEMEALPGSGLGLSICREIMERQNGELYIESREGVYFRAVLRFSPLETSQNFLEPSV